MTESQAILMQACGGPEVLQLRPMGLAPVQPYEVRLRMIAAAVNHTDLKICVGLWPIRRAHPFPNTPGVDLVGEVIETGAQM